LIARPSSLVIATGFSNAISFAPLSMPAFTNGSRTFGGVQKQKTSGPISFASAAASVLALAFGNFAAAAVSRC
jgi:hypothetical protein